MAELTLPRRRCPRHRAGNGARPDRRVFLGEDIAKAGGVFKAHGWSLRAVRPSSGARHADLRASDPWRGDGRGDDRAEADRRDHVRRTLWRSASTISPMNCSKRRYMMNGQLACPLVIRTGNGGGARFGAQHSASPSKTGRMMIPGVESRRALYTTRCHGLMAAADPRPRSGDFP